MCLLSHTDNANRICIALLAYKIIAPWRGQSHKTLSRNQNRRRKKKGTLSQAKKEGGKKEKKKGARGQILLRKTHIVIILVLVTMQMVIVFSPMNTISAVFAAKH